jgi:hypothetical protein
MDRQVVPTGSRLGNSQPPTTVFRAAPLFPFLPYKPRHFSTACGLIKRMPVNLSTARGCNLVARAERKLQQGWRQGSTPDDIAGFRWLRPRACSRTGAKTSIFIVCAARTGPEVLAGSALR